MKQTAPAAGTRSRFHGSWFPGWFGRYPLKAYRPRIRDGRFWMTQGLVLAIAAAHSGFERIGFIPNFGEFTFIPVALFLVPVVYAAINFGSVGALTTALWATALTVPNIIFQHQEAGRLWEASQMVIVLTVAVFLGQRVDRERGERKRVEAARAALRASEVRYRSLFESSPVAILLLDPAGTVMDANPAAGTLFARTPGVLKGMTAADLVGVPDAGALLNSSSGQGQPGYLMLKRWDALELDLEYTVTRAGDGQGNSIIQCLFRDVTEERNRQAGLRAYAAHIVRAQEEERQRIARELHDETVQQMVLLHRHLSGLPGTREPLPAASMEVLREARTITEEVIKELRGFTKRLRPPILDDLGLVVSVRSILSDMAQRTKMKGQMKVVGEQRRLPPDAELGMFRIAQEALWNLERHARATHVDVTIAFSEHQVSLEVLDNGIGFVLPPVSDFTTGGQLGLISMQERARLLQGRLVIQSSPEKGTRVTVSIPV